IRWQGAGGRGQESTEPLFTASGVSRLGGWELEVRSSACRPADIQAVARPSHLVLAQLFGVEALQPLLEAVAVGSLGVEVHRLRRIDDVLLDEDRRARAE